MTRLVLISDTHGLHDQVKVPDGDILVHAGDCTNDIGQASLRSFLSWFDRQPHQRKVFIAGNHDGAFEKWNKDARAMVAQLAPSATYLQEDGVTIDGVKFYGMPHTPAFCDWHFNVKRELMFMHTQRIPGDTDVLITHGPPYGILDVSGIDNEKCGCRALYEAVLEVQPRLHVFGHIHHSYGMKELVHDNGAKTWCVNAAICNERYKPVNAPVIFNL